MSQKRCIGQQFRLRPEPRTNNTYGYTLGLLQGKRDDNGDLVYAFELHDANVQSNHDHVLGTDPLAQRPKFIGELHSLVARAVNSYFGDTDAMWSASRHSAPVLLNDDRILEANVYLLLNGVKEGLVRYAKDWPGFTTYHMEYGVPYTFKRPEGFFSEDMPEEVTVTLTRPNIRPDLSDRELRELIRSKVKEREYEIRDEMRAKDRTFMGARRVMRQPRHNTPYTRDIRKGIRPHVAASSRTARIEALRDLRAFFASHEAARLEELAGGEPVYPYGTYKARLRGCSCADPP